MTKLSVALIGAGMIANAGHIPAWRNLHDDVELVGICDVDERRARDTAQRHGIPQAFGDHRVMLAALRPDIVSVCTPNAYHAQYAVAALEAGCHVFCEKPIATSLAEAQAMYAAAERAGRVLMVSQTMRWGPQQIAAKQLAQKGTLGEIYYAETAAMRRRGTPQWGQFHIKSASGGGPVYDLGVHILDSLLWIMGNPRVTAVSAVTYAKLARQDEQLLTSLAASGAPVGVYNPRPFARAEFDVEDMAAAFIRLETGATIAFKTSWAANVPDGWGGTMIVGDRAGLQFDPLTLHGAVGAYQADITPLVPSQPDIPFYGHWLAAEHLLHVLRGQQELIVQPAEVLNVMRTLDAIYRSAAAGHEVALDH